VLCALLCLNILVNKGVENLGLSSVGVAFAAEGARLMVVAAGDRGMWLLECFVDKVCSPAVKLASSLGNNTVFVPKSVQGGSGGYIAWSVVATDTDSRLHVNCVLLFRFVVANS
jgi:hypothetical protein